MEIKFINYLSRKVGGIENLLLILLILLFGILLGVYYRLDFMINVFDKMCFYEYPTDYICSCLGKTELLPNLGNFSISSWFYP